MNSLLSKHNQEAGSYCQKIFTINQDQVLCPLYIRESRPQVTVDRTQFPKTSECTLRDLSISPIILIQIQINTKYRHMKFVKTQFTPCQTLLELLKNCRRVRPRNAESKRCEARHTKGVPALK
jgi:hypothetical protein